MHSFPLCVSCVATVSLQGLLVMAASGRQAEAMLAMATGPSPCMRIRSISGPHHQPHQPRHGRPTQRTAGWPLPGPAAMHPGMPRTAAMGKPCRLMPSSMVMVMVLRRMQRRMA